MHCYCYYYSYGSYYVIAARVIPLKPVISRLQADRPIKGFKGAARAAIT